MQPGARERAPRQSRAERCSLVVARSRPGGWGAGRGARGRAGVVRTDGGQKGNPIWHHRVGFVDGPPFSLIREKKRKFLEEKPSSSDAGKSEPRWGFVLKRRCSRERGQSERRRGAGRRAEAPPAVRTFRGLRVRWRVGTVF